MLRQFSDIITYAIVNNAFELVMWGSKILAANDNTIKALQNHDARLSFETYLSIIKLSKICMD